MPGKRMALVSAAFETLEEAHEIAGRLSQAGFARNSIKVARGADDLFEVSLHVREANRARAERIIQNRATSGFGPLSSPGFAAMLGLGAAAVGLGIVAAVTVRKALPRYLRDGAVEAATPPREG